MNLHPRSRSRWAADCGRHARRETRRGLTLVEMLISVAITLILVLAVVQVFAVVGANVRVARGVMEVATDLRGVARQIQQDLETVTCPAHTWIDPESGLGYLEIVEGPLRDRDFMVAPPPDGRPMVVFDNAGNEVLDTNVVQAFPRALFATELFAPEPTVAYDSSFGDLDDWLAMTIRSDGQPFLGRAPNGTIIESNEAEVIYWTAFLDFNGNATYDAEEPIYLMRRVLLIATSQPPLPTLTPQQHVLQDVSVTFDNIKNVVRPNSLGDLTNPANRSWYAFRAAFPRVLQPADVSGPLSRFILMSDLRGFDVRVYDPLAPIIDGGDGVALSPGDVGYPTTAQNIRKAFADGFCIGRGAFVDIGYAVNFAYDATVPIPNLTDPGLSDLTAIGIWFPGVPRGRISYFSGVPSFYEDPMSGVDRQRQANESFWTPFGVLSGTASPALFFTMFRYDTWSSYFNRDGIEFRSQDNPAIDWATDGLDNDTVNGVDDPGERDTAPPYDVPLRGIEVRLRMMHYELRQVRQVSVVSDFVPE